MSNCMQMHDEKTNVHTAIVLDKRRKKIDGSFPVKLRVTYRQQQKYYATGIALTEKQFEKAQAQKPRKEYKEYQLELRAKEQKAVDIIKSLPRFSFETFDRLYHTRGGSINSIYSAFENYIAKLYAEDRVGTASSYECAFHSLKKVSGKSQLHFSEVDVEFLKAYEKKMQNNGATLTTIGIYARCMRTLFNEAIETGIINREFYPFGKRRYQIPASRNIKKALPLSDIQKLFSYKPVNGPMEQWAMDMWKFSYLCNGMNIKDIAHLRFRDIVGDEITFVRAKTIYTKRENQKTILVPLLPITQKIIRRWQRVDSAPNNYVFNILSNEYDAKKALAKVRQATKTINKYMKRIAKNCGILMPVTTYTARHSWATVMRNSGAPISLISDGLGHGSIPPTERYLATIESDTRKKFAEGLVAFQ